MKKALTISCDVVLLPTEKPSNIRLSHLDVLKYYVDRTCRDNSQHLYFISNEKIKEGDWVMNTASLTGYMQVVEIHNDPLFECVQEEGEHAMCQSFDSTNKITGVGDIPLSQLRKIVATTDTLEDFYGDVNEENQRHENGLLKAKSIPQIPESFIKAYVESHNTDALIKTVRLKCDGEYDNHYEGWYADTVRVKVRPEDNTVIIHQSKKYSKEEMIEAYKQGAIDYCNSPMPIDQFLKTDFDKRIENL